MLLPAILELYRIIQVYIEVKIFIQTFEDYFSNSLLSLPAYHPGLTALWSTDRRNPHHQNKWKLFLGAISPSIDNIGVWMALPDNMVVSTAACYYLFYVSIMQNRRYAANCVAQKT